MEALFSKDYALLWVLVLALALFVPVRQLLFMLSVRRASRQTEVDEAEARRLKRRAAATSALICFVFSYFYVNYLFGGAP